MKEQNIYPEYNPQYRTLRPRFEVRWHHTGQVKAFNNPHHTRTHSSHSSKQAAVREMLAQKKLYPLSNWMVVKVEVVSVWPR